MGLTAQRRPVGANVKNSVLVEDRRERIVEAAIEVFLAKGFHVATTRDVCIKAGITQGTLYNYVRTKGDILYLVCDQAVTRYQEAIAAAVAEVSEPRERLVRALRAMLEAQDRHRKNIVLVLRESHALDPASRRAVQARVDSFVDTIRDLIAAASPGAVDPASAALLAEVVTYLPTMLAMRRWRVRRDLAAADVLAGLLGLMLRLLDLPQGVGPAPSRQQVRRKSPAPRARRQRTTD
jgi:AcrR family transcriptional regulator